MKLSHFLLAIYGAASTVTALSVPRALNELALRDADASVSLFESRAASLIDSKALEKRKGGGGRGGSSGSSGGRSGSSGSSSSSGRTSSSSNAGGRTSSGSGARTAYGSSKSYYGGGATVPYTAGSRSPLGLTPVLIPLTALAFVPALWAYSYGAYGYHYSHPYSFRNTSDANNNGTNTTLPVECFCEEYTVCGCDDNNDTSYYTSLIGNGSYAALNKSLVTVAEVNGSDTLVINGVLPNGTTASGGSDSGATEALARFSGWWGMVAAVVAMVWL